MLYRIIFYHKLGINSIIKVGGRACKYSKQKKEDGMKRVLALLLILLMVFTLTACFKKQPTNELAKQNSTTKETTTEETTIDDTEEYLDDDGDVKISEDGWEYTDEEGNKTAIGGTWPDNEYTQLIPEPSFGTLSFTDISTTDGFIAQFGGGTIEDTKQYIKDLQDKGFNNNEELFDGSKLEGMESYSFSAQNNKGVTVAVDYALGIFMVQVTK